MDPEKQKPAKWIETQNHSEECDLLTLLNSIYLFCETSTTLIDGSKKGNHWW